MARNDYGVVFNGRRIVHPGAYDYIDASAMNVTTQGSLDVPIVVGNANAGQSGQVMWFTSVDTARQVLNGGDLVTALDLMFSPSPEGGGGASLVGVMVANTTTQATVTAGGMVFTSLEYSANANRTSVRLEDGTITGSKRLTASRWDTEVVESFDDLGAIFNLKYTGIHPYAVVSVTTVGGVSTQLTINTGADQATSTVDVTVDLTDPKYATVGDVVNYISGIAGYSISYVNFANRDMPSNSLDMISNVSIISGAYVMGVIGDIKNQINSYSTLVTVTVQGTGVTNFSDTYLSGGSLGSTPTSWAPYFDTIKKQFSDVLVVLSGDPSIHAEALTHVQQMELRNQKQMLFTGGQLNESVSQVKQRAMSLNSSRAVLAYPGIKYKGSSSDTQLLAPYFTGALLAGRVVGVDPSEPITFDYFNLVDLEIDLIAGDPDIDDLITSGVATLEKVSGKGIRLVQGITTYLGGNNTLYREISVRRGADNLSGTMRQQMEDTFVGKKGTPATIAAITVKAIDILEQAKRTEQITSYRNIVVTIVGTVVTVSYEVAPTQPINFVLVTSHFVPDTVVA